MTFSGIVSYNYHGKSQTMRLVSDFCSMEDLEAFLDSGLLHVLDACGAVCSLIVPTGLDSFDCRMGIDIWDEDIENVLNL